MHPEENFNELDPEALYNLIKKIVNQTISDFRGIEFNSRLLILNYNFKFYFSLLDSHKIKCFGLSTQRNSVILWNK